MFFSTINVSINGPLFNAQRPKRILCYQQLGVASMSIELLTPCLKKLCVTTHTLSTLSDRISFATLLEAKYSCPLLSTKTSIRAVIRTTRSSFTEIHVSIFLLFVKFDNVVFKPPQRINPFSAIHISELYIWLRFTVRARQKK